jgi:hypothetical protein
MSYKSVWLLILFPLIACEPFHKAPPPPSPSPIHVQIPLTLKPAYEEILGQCNAKITELAIFLDVVPEEDLSLESSDMILRMGESKEITTDFAFQIGWEQVILIASPDVEIEKLSISQIRKLFTSSPPPLNIWTYPDNYEINRYFKESFIGDLEISGYAFIAVNPGEMVESIRSEPNSLGYIPKSWLIDDVQEISIDQTTQELMTYPVIILTNHKPEGPVTEFLVCLQNNWKQSETILGSK